MILEVAAVYSKKGRSTDFETSFVKAKEIISSYQQ